MAVTVRPVTEAVGAEISGVDLRRLSDQDFAAIEQAWTRHSMILLRGQQLSDDDLLAFSRRFGELDPPPNQERGRISPPGYPDIYVVSNVLDAKGEPIGALGAGEAAWHVYPIKRQDAPVLRLDPIECGIVGALGHGEDAARVCLQQHLRCDLNHDVVARRHGG